MSDMTAQQMVDLAARADTESVQQLAESAPTEQGRQIARDELNRRR
jgi:hypothetical protein